MDVLSAPANGVRRARANTEFIFIAVEVEQVGLGWVPEAWLPLYFAQSIHGAHMHWIIAYGLKKYIDSPEDSPHFTSP